MLAFWLVAAIAAAVTSLGLLESGPRVTVRAGSASPVTPDGSSGLLLGGSLRPVPTLVGTVRTSPTPASWPSASTVAYVATQDEAVVRPATASRTHAEAGAAPSRPRAAGTTTRPTTTEPRPQASTTPAGHGHGRALGHAPGQGPGHGKPRLQASSTRTHGHGHGHAHVAHGKSGH
jgi:hypothetical protein